MAARPGDRCWQSGDDALPANQTHGRADPSNVVQCHAELYIPQRGNLGATLEDYKTRGWQVTLRDPNMHGP